MIYKSLEKIEKGEGGYLFYTQNLFTGHGAVFTVNFGENMDDLGE